MEGQFYTRRVSAGIYFLKSVRVKFQRSGEFPKNHFRSPISPSTSSHRGQGDASPSLNHILGQSHQRKPQLKFGDFSKNFTKKIKNKVNSLIFVTKFVKINSAKFFFFLTNPRKQFPAKLSFLKVFHMLSVLLSYL